MRQQLQKMNGATKWVVLAGTIVALLVGLGQLGVVITPGQIVQQVQTKATTNAKAIAKQQIRLQQLETQSAQVQANIADIHTQIKEQREDTRRVLQMLIQMQRNGQGR